METYYFKYKNPEDSSQNIIHEKLLNSNAQSYAKKFVKQKTLNNGKEVLDEKNSVSPSQLRRFFNDFRGLEKKSKNKPFEVIYPMIKMVKSKVAYASNKIPKSFQDFLMKSVDEIKDKEDFEAFMLHLEAVVGFCYGEPNFRK